MIKLILLENVILSSSSPCIKFGINDASVVSSLRTMQVLFEWSVWMQNKNRRDAVLVRLWHTVLTWPGERVSVGVSHCHWRATVRRNKKAHDYVKIAIIGKTVTKCMRITLEKKQIYCKTGLSDWLTDILQNWSELPFFVKCQREHPNRGETEIHCQRSWNLAIVQKMQGDPVYDYPDSRPVGDRRACPQRGSLRSISVLDRLLLTHPVWLQLSVNSATALHILRREPPGVSSTFGLPSALKIDSYNQTFNNIFGNFCYLVDLPGA